MVSDKVLLGLIIYTTVRLCTPYTPYLRGHPLETPSGNIIYILLILFYGKMILSTYFIVFSGGVDGRKRYPEAILGQGEVYRV